MISLYINNSNILGIILTLMILFNFISCNELKKHASENPADTIPGKVETGVAEKNDYFLFVGNYFGKPSVYRYDIQKKKYKVRWNDYKESVVLLLSEPSRPVSFFLTARGYGKKENHSYVNRLKLYRFIAKSDEIIFVDEIGSGIQFTADWNDMGNIQIQLTAVDKTVASFINKFNKVYDNYGRMITDEMQTFDMTKEGYPELITQRSSTISPSGKFGLSIYGDSLFIKMAKSEDRNFIGLIAQNIHDVSWNYNESFVFISTLNLQSKTKKNKILQTSELFSYDIKNKILNGYWDGSGIKNYEVLNRYLIFDNDFGSKAAICVYDYSVSDSLALIKIYDGCGLKLIPKLN